MTPPMVLILALVAAAPILALILFVRLRKRASGRPGRSDLFEPKAEQTPFLLLCRFTLPQRTYLNQQFVAARICFLLCTYFLVMVVCVALLPGDLHLVTRAGHPQQVWERFRDQLLMAGYISEVFSFIIAVVVITALRTPPYATFDRTRPLSFHFLFWGRVLLGLASLLAATQAALLASILLLTLIYGAVWKLVAVPVRSVFQLDLSLLTTTALIFAIFVFLAFLPRPRGPVNGKWKFIYIFLGSTVGSQAVYFSRFLSTTFTPRVLFLFPASLFAGGAPPPGYAYALIPIGCVVLLLFLAARLSTRFEI